MYTNYISGLKQHLLFFRQQYWNHGHTYFTSVNSAFTSVLHVIAVTEGHWLIENPVITEVILQPRARLYSNMFLIVRNIRSKQQLFFIQKQDCTVSCLRMWETSGQNINYSSAKSETVQYDVVCECEKHLVKTAIFFSQERDCKVRCPWVWGTFSQNRHFSSAKSEAVRTVRWVWVWGTSVQNSNYYFSPK